MAAFSVTASGSTRLRRMSPRNSKACASGRRGDQPSTTNVRNRLKQGGRPTAPSTTRSCRQLPETTE
eukprot:12385575-Alexandrium_andersonii.AAC.1